MVDGVYYDLDCHVNARGLLACAANINKNSIGSPAQVFFGDFTFESIVPEGNRATSYCYGVFDYDTEEIWQQFTTHCQSSPANVEI